MNTIIIEIGHKPALTDVLNYINDKGFQKEERLHIVCSESTSYAMVTKHSPEQFFFLSHLGAFEEDLIKEKVDLPDWEVYRENEPLGLDPSYEVYYLVKEDQYYCCSIQR